MIIEVNDVSPKSDNTKNEEFPCSSAPLPIKYLFDQAVFIFLKIPTSFDLIVSINALPSLRYKMKWYSLTGSVSIKLETASIEGCISFLIISAKPFWPFAWYDSMKTFVLATMNVAVSGEDIMMGQSIKW